MKAGPARCEARLAVVVLLCTRQSVEEEALGASLHRPHPTVANNDSEDSTTAKNKG